MSSLNCFDCHELEQELKIALIMADTAYKRGREDAARDVRTAIHVPLMDVGGPLKVAKIIDAARGNGYENRN